MSYDSPKQPIERLLLVFLEEVLNREKIDLIVCCERKATAILRILVQEISPPRLQLDWHKILSTSAISQYDWSSFQGKRILLFDEMVHHGRNLEKQERELREYAPEHIEIITGAFAVWDRCDYEPKLSYYKALDSEICEEVREEIISMLQRYGSVLLDTEHIELTVRLQCGVRDFYNDLARSTSDGKTFSFLSGAGRTNLTIHDPDIVSEADLKRCLIPGSNTKGSVSKCRVLERDHELFSIIPIYYPNTRCVSNDEWLNNLPSFVDRDKLKNAKPKEFFYLSGLLASIELLKGVVSSLSDLRRKQRVILETPKEHFRHLHAVFPNVNVDGLWEYVRQLVGESRRIKPRRSRGSVQARNVPAARLQNLSFRTISRLLGEADDYDPRSTLPKGKSWYELLCIAQESNQDMEPDPNELTVVPDRLIDGGLLVTNVEEVRTSKGEVWAIRTFEPAGEIVSDKLRRQIMVRGTSWLPVT